MKKSLSLLFALLFLFNQSFSQINTTIPDWVEIVDVKIVNNINKHEINGGIYYLLIDNQYNTIERHKYIHFASKAITEEALVEVSQIEFSYDPSYETAHLHFVKIYRDNKVIDKTSSVKLKILKEESQRKFGILNGNETIYINLSDIRKGDIVEYSFSVIGKNPIMKDYFNIDIYLSYSVPIEKIHQRVIFSKNIQPSISYNNCTVKPKIKGGLVNDYTWEINNPKVITVESSTPMSYDPYQLVQISNFKNWSEVKNHSKTLMKVPKYDMRSIKAIVDSIVNSSQNIEMEISSIIEFVQTHIRYSGNENGIYSFVPRTPDFVLKNRFGDCKEKSALLNEMLNLINIEAYPVLINSSIGKEVAKKNPSLNAFNHCISAFKYNNQLNFVDPTISYQRGNFKLRIIPNYEIGMVLDSSKNAFVPIPIDLESKNFIKEEFVIEKSGDTRLKVTSLYTGTNADDIRYQFLTNSINDIQESYKKFYSKYSENIDVIDTISFNDNEASNEFTTIEYYLLNKFWKASDSSKSKIIEKTFLPYSLNEKFNYGDEDKRNDPLRISFPLNTTHTITINKEEGGWNIDEDLKSENNRYFDYSFTTKLTGNTLNLIYNYVSKTGIIEPKNYLDYKAKMEFVNYNIAFNPQQKPLTSGTLGFNWPLLLTILGAFLISSILSLFLYKKPNESIYINKYSSIGGWLILVGIGVTLTPIGLLASLYSEYHAEMDVNYIVYFFNIESDYFSPLIGYFTFFIAFINSLMCAFSIFILIIFYQKKASFRLYFSLFKLFNCLFLILDVIVLYNIYGNSSDMAERTMLSSQTTTMMRVLIQSCIWVPYVWFSERSKHTFTRETTAPFNKDKISL